MDIAVNTGRALQAGVVEMPLSKARFNMESTLSTRGAGGFEVTRRPRARGNGWNLQTCCNNNYLKSTLNR